MTPNEPGLGWSEAYLGGSPEAEERRFREFEKTIVALQVAMATRSDGVTRRGFHAKTIVSVPHASFRCSADLPRALQVGLFHPAREYLAVVRFSSSPSDVQPDANRQGHGIGFRLLAPEGSHDLLLSDGPISHARDAEQFMALADALTSRLRIVTIIRLARRVGLVEAARMLRSLLQSSTANLASVATQSYWSRTAFSFAGRAARLVLRPHMAPAPERVHGRDYLRDEMARRLSRGDVQFDLAAQLFVDATRTPIEDGSIEWLETVSPPIALGRLVLPRQDLTSADAQRDAAKVDRLAFNPWSVVGDVRPLGSLNRARNAVYLASAEKRRAESTRAPNR